MSNITKKIRLNLYSNCFNSNKSHLGFKYNGILYCLTHSQCGNSFLIKSEELHMKMKSDRKQFIKPALNQKALFVNTTGMFVNKEFIVQNIHRLNV